MSLHFKHRPPNKLERRYLLGQILPVLTHLALSITTLFFSTHVVLNGMPASHTSALAAIYTIITLAILFRLPADPSSRRVGIAMTLGMAALIVLGSTGERPIRMINSWSLTPLSQEVVALTGLERIDADGNLPAYLLKVRPIEADDAGPVVTAATDLPIDGQIYTALTGKPLPAGACMLLTIHQGLLGLPFITHVSTLEMPSWIPGRDPG